MSTQAKPRSRYSLSFEKRLHYPWEYRRFFSNSEVFRFSECVVFRIPNTLGHYRLGITIKARGRSVDRNRVKRQIREAFRLSAARLGSYDYNVVIPGNKKIVHPFPEKLGKSLRKGLERAFGCE